MAICPVAFLTLAAPDIIEIPIQIAWNNQIKESVLVQIHPCRAGGPAASSHARLLGNISECAVAVIVVELVSSICGYVKIFEAVIVVVADGNAHSVTCSLHARLLGHVLECAVCFLVVQAVPILRIG